MKVYCKSQKYLPSVWTAAKSRSTRSSSEDQILGVQSLGYSGGMKSFSTAQETTASSSPNAEQQDLNGPEGSLGENNWLLQCPEARVSVERGLADAAAGRGVEISFLQYAAPESEDAP